MGKQQVTSGALRVVITGGGTGGHLFPGVAIAQEFRARDPQNKTIFIGTGKSIEMSILSKTPFKYKSIVAEGIKGRGFVKLVRSILKIPRGIFESILILKGFRPDLVIGVGSYSAGPVVIGAWLLGIKIVLHEQNVLPGVTNRILSHFADRIYVSFNYTKAGFNPQKVRVTGNPVRHEILQCKRNQSKPKIEEGTEIADLRPGFSQDRLPFTILIVGGSQGAHSLNLAVMEAVEYIKERDKFFFVHQTGADDEKRVKDTYLRYGIACTVKSFFDDMAKHYQKADLVICRAGATTVAEVMAIGKGAIFVPYPFAADNHQVLNARSIADRGAAEMILQRDFSGKLLARRINYYASKPEALYRMAARAREFGRPDAARIIVDDCYKLIEPKLN